MTGDPVIIAGGGPTGLMLAGELRLAGTPVIVLERNDEPPRWSRSQTLQMRSIETFRQRGLDWFGGYGQARTYNFGLLELIGVIDPELVALRVPQRDVELLLDARARELGTDLRRGHEVVGLTQDDDAVHVEVAGPRGTYRLRGAYLAGCDGGRSAIRKMSGIPFIGGPSPYVFTGITGDVRLENPAFGRVGPDLYPRGMFAVLPMEQGVHRVTVLEFGHPAPAEDQPVTVAEVAAGAHRVAGFDLRVAEPVHLSRFGGATLLAERYREGRVFLCGDAAHVHMPFGGQGLNTGVQDAANLGWKLSAAVAGWAPPGLLASYHAERHPVGARVCQNTKAQMSLLHPLETIGPLRELLGELLRFDDVSRHLFEMLAAVDIAYPIGYPDGAHGSRSHPLLGRRMPPVALTTESGTTDVAGLLHTARGVLLTLGTDAGSVAADAGRWARRIDIVAAEPVAHLDAAVVLVRPDGYVAWADPTGKDEDGLRLALRTWFGEPAPAIERRPQ